MTPLTTATFTRCPGCQHPIPLVVDVNEYRLTHDGRALELDEQCPRCDVWVTRRLTTTRRRP